MLFSRLAAWIQLGSAAAAAIFSGIAFCLKYPSACWLLWFSGTALVIFFDFLALVRLVKGLTSGGWSARKGSFFFFSTQLRLLITGILGYVAFAWLNAPVSAIVCGVGLLPISLICAGLMSAAMSAQLR
ncbi:MAG: hypothetical protein PUB69_02175 [Desulfovibrionaceae bacterium]|nr:hypothetical protein [Desulfovibrionaceae bacterium]